MLLPVLRSLIAAPHRVGLQSDDCNGSRTVLPAMSTESPLFL